MAKLVLIRHGQSEWNLQNRFTGWWDVNLTDKGVAEAKKSGQMLAASGVAFDQAFVSVQKRAIRTLWIALEEMERTWLPVTKDWHLNERHYGGLTGLDKAETAAKHGKDQVQIWRRSYDVPPPPMEKGAEFDPANDVRYAGLDVPMTESLKLTLERVMPYFNAEIAPLLKADKNILIAAHGNSLRAIVKDLFDVADDVITGVEIPTGNPLMIDLDADLKVKSAAYMDADRATEIPSF
ncbi:2,3-diphosphoglycerate-dependent phosphoglycerate mutase [Hirschia baltica]|uniref:2,3-bisphosphoglycerate-dependent phosphoglycerate mutase n=1 Tax=Hirschia baltica (strain ATCC 49814 / DSM 5838 / IFAM 1418) TaxID=582402 RepID=C6XKF1_HIRBI|nr:2,3-diphosphoglycerate-dependent phosphoglycerate mutase [Hirschia baltica]ACT57749.1 phosphoglycerate mutase 1 family [Hirschia baltica ATCC 49814]